jgi:hypothetical protein
VSENVHLELLKRARAIVERLPLEQRGYYGAYDDDERPKSPTLLERGSEGLRSCCTLGGLIAAAGEIGLNLSGAAQTSALLATTLMESLPNDHPARTTNTASVPIWNDKFADKEAVLALYDRAIELAAQMED